MPALRILSLLLMLASGVAGSLAAEQWKAGVAKVQITPTKPIWLTGFAARTNVSRGTLHELYVKALALEDEAGRRAVLITSDLLGFPADVAERIARDVEKQFRVPRDRLLLNSSHTHGAPALANATRLIYGPRSNPGHWRDIEEYTRDLEKKVVGLVGTALGALRPARLSFAEGTAGFGMNRRKKTDSGITSFVPNPDGPVDHAVPVLRVDTDDGVLRAIVFGYAAHPTTAFAASELYLVSADYAGFTQERIEKEHPGAIALFVQGCGGDIMVYPRGTLELARKHGEALAAAVATTVAGTTRPVRGPLKTVFDRVPVAFAEPPGRDALEKQLKHDDLYHRWHAQEMLKILDRDGALPASYPYPLQVWQFGRELTLVAMGGEVVVDYSVRLKKELSGTLWVAGYSNDVFAYIPSRRVLEEGGYEGGGAMIYYVQPGPFAPTVEETIVRKTHELVERVRKEQP